MTRVDDLRWIHRWNAAVWLCFGLAPVVIAGQDDPGAMRYWSPALAAVLALGYAVALRYPGARTAFLLVLVVGLAVSSYLRSGGASLFIVSIPHFWVFGGTVRRTVVLSGTAALATVLGGVLRNGDPVTGNAVVTVLAYLASVVLGLAILRILERSEQRADRLAAELAAAQQRLAAASRREGATSERERLAREIHDTLAQGFASIVVLAEAARSGLAADPAASTRQLASIERTARENLAEARALVGSPSVSVAGSIRAVLQRTLARFAEDTGLTVEADLPDVDCDQPTRVALLRCAQESLANVRKHASASTVSVVLSRHPYGLELEITDDGAGFDSTRPSSGFGLGGMRRRLEELGGDLTVTSSPGDGTRVLALLPTGVTTP